MKKIIGKHFKYKIIKNILNNEEQDLLKRFCILSLRNNDNEFNDNASNLPNYGKYSDYIMEALLLSKHKLFEKETGLELIPTYSYWRMYTYGSNLVKHKDRPACEISCTINIANSGEKWPIYMDGKPLNLKPGDGAVYMGMDVKHWREDFKGDFSANVFLHYVNKNGNYVDYAKDERVWYGQPKVRKV